MRFRDASTIQADATSFLATLNFVAADRVEVLRGSGSSLYGTNAVGGVVNIVTRPGGGALRPRGTDRGRIARALPHPRVGQRRRPRRQAAILRRGIAIQSVRRARRRRRDAQHRRAGNGAVRRLANHEPDGAGPRIRRPRGAQHQPDRDGDSCREYSAGDRRRRDPGVARSDRTVQPRPAVPDRRRHLHSRPQRSRQSSHLELS